MWHFLHVAKTLAGVGHAQYLVNLDDVSKGSQVCETVVIVDLGHDDDSMWQVYCSTSDASGSFFVAGAVLCSSQTKSARNPR